MVMNSQIWFTVLVALVAAERLFELRLSAKNAAWAFKQGGVERGAGGREERGWSWGGASERESERVGRRLEPRRFGLEARSGIGSGSSCCPSRRPKKEESQPFLEGFGGVGALPFAAEHGVAPCRLWQTWHL
jgi:hypothetical protein